MLAAGAVEPWMRSNNRSAALAPISSAAWADAGQGGLEVGGERQVAVADHRDMRGHVDPLLGQCAVQAEGEVVAACQYRGTRFEPAHQLSGALVGGTRFPRQDPPSLYRRHQRDGVVPYGEAAFGQRAAEASTRRSAAEENGTSSSSKWTLEAPESSRCETAS